MHIRRGTVKLLFLHNVCVSFSRYFPRDVFSYFLFFVMCRFRLGLVVLAAIIGVLKPRVLFQISVRF